MRRTPSKGRITRNSFQTIPETECGPQHLVLGRDKGCPCCRAPSEPSSR
jgi:hypothetical protein